MNILQAIFLGLVEGLTEFLPISSTFHLVWTARILGITQSDFEKLFEIVIQSGTILAVVVMYLKTVLTNRKLAAKIIVSFIPTSIIGLVLYKVIVSVFLSDYLLQLAVFTLVGVVFIGFEKLRRNYQYRRNADEVSFGEAIFIGIAQALAVIPGVSRSGAVIVALMLIGVKRDEAAKYSFILAVPTIVAASGYDLFKQRTILAGQVNNIELLGLGFVASAVSAYVVVKWFIGYLQRHEITVFGWYRIAAAAVLALVFR